MACGYIGNASVELLQVNVNLSRGHRGAIPMEVPFYRGDVGD